MMYLLYLCGLGLSAVAAYYSIMGLIAIFSTAVVPIAIMGSILEASKLVSASWLYRNWKTAPKLLKAYFTSALVVLMLLTSMGIFGYLSKAHLDQAVPTGDVASKIAILDEKIKTEKENIDAARKAISQLDSQVDSTLSRTTEASGADRAVAIRRGQAKERASLLAEISASQAKVAKLNEERAPIASELRKVEAEVGPIKYIAALIYGDTLDDTLLEKSVRIVILMIVFVFDPLAVLMLIAANRESLQKKEPEVESHKPDAWVADVTMPDPDPLPEIDETMLDEPEEEIVIPEPYDNDAPWRWLVTELGREPISADEEIQEFFDNVKQQAKDLDDNSTWQIPEPPKETPEEFKKVVNEYFHPEEPVEETMLYVNEEPETVILNPDFSAKDPFMEKQAPPVRPNSRRTPD
jgi:hypothetical protein